MLTQTPPPASAQTAALVALSVERRESSFPSFLANPSTSFVYVEMGHNCKTFGDEHIPHPGDYYDPTDDDACALRQLSAIRRYCSQRAATGRKNTGCPLLLPRQATNAPHHPARISGRRMTIAFYTALRRPPAPSPGGWTLGAHMERLVPNKLSNCISLPRHSILFLTPPPKQICRTDGGLPFEEYIAEKKSSCSTGILVAQMHLSVATPVRLVVMPVVVASVKRAGRSWDGAAVRHRVWQGRN